MESKERDRGYLMVPPYTGLPVTAGVGVGSTLVGVGTNGAEVGVAGAVTAVAVGRTRGAGGAGGAGSAGGIGVAVGSGAAQAKVSTSKAPPIPPKSTIFSSLAYDFAISHLLRQSNY